jgi:hypothetical protein
MLCFGAGRAILARLHRVDGDPRLAEGAVDASKVSPPCSSSLQHRIDEEQDLSHESLELRRLFPVRENEFL